jgi:hypothetical protein
MYTHTIRKFREGIHGLYPWGIYTNDMMNRVVIECDPSKGIKKRAPKRHQNASLQKASDLKRVQAKNHEPLRGCKQELNGSSKRAFERHWREIPLGGSEQQAFRRHWKSEPLEGVRNSRKEELRASRKYQRAKVSGRKLEKVSEKDIGPDRSRQLGARVWVVPVCSRTEDSDWSFLRLVSLVSSITSSFALAETSATTCARLGRASVGRSSLQDALPGSRGRSRG